ncbi:MAG: hypothetical protein NTW16_09725 [Bacteroidetes bacterium]|nr:hypothetical protein [Bacteroidota bacterium]
MKRSLIFLALMMVNLPVFSQVVYEDVSNTGIYDFLDELANLKLITLNSAVKPYSRTYIADKLHEADIANERIRSTDDKPSHQLSKRQQKELHFYMQDFQLEQSSHVTRQASRLAHEYDYRLSFMLKK